MAKKPSTETGRLNEADKAPFKTPDVLRAFAEAHLDAKPHGGKLKFKCPCRAHSKDASGNPADWHGETGVDKNGDGVWICRACDVGGDVFKLAEAVNYGSDFRDIARRLHDEFSNPLTPHAEEVLYGGGEVKKSKRSRASKTSTGSTSTATSSTSTSTSTAAAEASKPVEDEDERTPVFFVTPEAENAAWRAMDALANNPAMLDKFASELGLPADFLRDCASRDAATALGLTPYGQLCYVFATVDVRDGKRHVCGIKVRASGREGERLPYLSKKGVWGEVEDRSMPRFAFVGGVRGQRLYGVDGTQGVDVIFITEGESDALAANHALRVYSTEHQLAAAAVAIPGAHQFLPVWLTYVENKRVYIIADGDKPGRDSAFDVAAMVSNTAAEVNIWFPPEGIKDFRQFYSTKKSKADAVADVFDRATAYTAGEPVLTDGDGKPIPAPFTVLGWQPNSDNLAVFSARRNLVSFVSPSDFSGRKIFSKVADANSVTSYLVQIGFTKATHWKESDIVAWLQQRFLDDADGEFYNAAIVKPVGFHREGDSIIYSTGDAAWTWDAEAGAVARVDLSTPASGRLYIKKNFTPGMPRDLDGIAPLSDDARRAVVHTFNARAWEEDYACRLFLGALIASPFAMLEGAYRPFSWVVSEKGSGKSELADLVCLKLFRSFNGYIPSSAGTDAATSCRFDEAQGKPFVYDEAEGNSEAERAVMQTLLNRIRTGNTGEGRGRTKMDGGAAVTQACESCVFLFSTVDCLEKETDVDRYTVFHRRKIEDPAEYTKLEDRQTEGVEVMDAPDFTARLFALLLAEAPNYLANVKKLTRYLREKCGLYPRNALDYATREAGFWLISNGGEVNNDFLAVAAKDAAAAWKDKAFSETPPDRELINCILDHVDRGSRASIRQLVREAAHFPQGLALDTSAEQILETYGIFMTVKGGVSTMHVRYTSRAAEALFATKTAAKWLRTGAITRAVKKSDVARVYTKNVKDGGKRSTCYTLAIDEAAFAPAENTAASSPPPYRATI